MIITPTPLSNIKLKGPLPLMVSFTTIISRSKRNGTKARFFCLAISKYCWAHTVVDAQQSSTINKTAQYFNRTTMALIKVITIGFINLRIIFIGSMPKSPQ
jgi:hypothetical protein